MKTTNLLKTTLAISLTTFLFIGCSSEDSASETNDTSVQGVIVDPYIEGAVLCEDVNKDGVCNASEQNSSSSTSAGVFGFNNELTAGSHIIIKEQGIHAGKRYDLNISGVVSSTGSIDVVSPLTTFETKGLTTTQIAEILNKAATDSGLTSWAITADDITADPLSDGLEDKKISDLSDSDLVNIQASLASYGILKIMSGSDALSELSPTELYYSGMGLNGHTELLEITKVMLSNIVATLNKTMLTTVKTGIDTGKGAMVQGGIPQTTANTGLPEPTASLIIKVAVSIIDRLAEIGYTECNATGGDVSAALTEVGNNQAAITAQAAALGSQMYGLTYHSQMKSSFQGMYALGLTGIFSADSNIENGYNAKENNHSTIRFDSSNNLVSE